MKKLGVFILFVNMCILSSSQIYTGYFRTVTDNSNYHQFLRNGYGAAVYINQASTSSNHPILRLSSGHSDPNVNVKFTVENNGYVGIGTTSPSQTLDVIGNIRVGDNGYGGGGILLTRFQIYQYATDNQLDINPYRVLRLGRSTNNSSFAVEIYKGNNTTTINHRLSGNAKSSLYLNNSNLGIGTNTPSAKLDVAGTIRAEEIIVEANNNTADFVFESDYNLRNLSEVESFIKTNKHLPDIPSAAEMEEQGVNLAEMNKLLLQKVEELTLYAIEKDKEMKALKEERAKEKRELETLEDVVFSMEKELVAIRDMIINKNIK